MLQSAFKKRLLDALPETALIPFVESKAIVRDNEWTKAIVKWDLLSLEEIRKSPDEYGFETSLERWEQRVAALISFVKSDVLVKSDPAPVGSTDDVDAHKNAIFKTSPTERSFYSKLLADIYERVSHIGTHPFFATHSPDPKPLVGTVVNLAIACCVLDDAKLLRKMLSDWPEIITAEISTSETGAFLFSELSVDESVCIQMYAFQFSSLNCYMAIKEAYEGADSVPLMHTFVGDNATTTTPIGLMNNMAGAHFGMHCKADVFLQMLQLEDQDAEFHKNVSQLLGCFVKEAPDLTAYADHLIEQGFCDAAPLMYLIAAVEWGHTKAVKTIVVDKKEMGDVLSTDKNPAVLVLNLLCRAQDQKIKHISASENFDESLAAFNRKLVDMGLGDKIFDAFPRRKLSYPEPLQSMLKCGRKTILLNALELGLQPRTPIREGFDTPIDYARALGTEHALNGMSILISWNARSTAHSILDGMDCFKSKAAVA